MGLLSSAREVFVRITGQEDVSVAAGKAGSSLKSLGTQAKSLLPTLTFGDVARGLGVVVDASNELAASMRKLEGTAKITGTSLDALQAIAGEAQGKFKLSTVLANDFATELAKLASKAGDVGKAAPGMEAFLEIGAARGLSAADTLKAVQQSILGIDEGTDKLFGKNPSVLYKEYADQIGTTAGKLTDQQKAQALLTAALTDGLKVQGSYQDYLKSAAGQQEQLNIQLRQAAVELGKALTPALLGILPVVTSVAKGIGDFVQFVQLLGVRTAILFEEVPNQVKRVNAQVLVALGELVSRAGDFLPFFGGKVKALGDQMIAEGTRQVQASEAYSRALAEARRESEEEILGVVKKSGAAQVVATRQSAGTVTTITTEELQKRAAAEAKAAKEAAEAREKANREQLKQLETLGQWLGRERDKQARDAKESAEQLAQVLGVNLGEATARSLQLTTDAMERLLVQLRGRIPIEQWQALNAEVQRHKRDLSDLLPPAESLAESVREAKEYNERFAQATKDAKPDLVKLVQDSATLARAFLDAGQAVGLIDQKMASILSSAISLSANIAKAFGGDPTAIAASVTSLANIIVGIGTSETERRRRAAAEANTQALDRLTREVGNLNLRESGKTFAGVQNAVQASIDARAAARAAGKGPGEADKAAYDAFIKSLREQGIGLDEARRLFKELFGRDLAMANKGTFFQDILAFSQGLAETEFGQFGQDFEGQLDALTKGFDILGITDDDEKLAEFKKLASKFSPALAKALDVDLSTAEGRAQATKNLRDLFQKLNSGGLKPEDIGVSGGQFLSLLQSLLPLLASADGSLPAPPTTASNTTTSGALYRVPPIDGLGTFGVGAPAITSRIADVPNTQTTINGGVTVTITIDGARDATETAEAVAREVSRVLGTDYRRQLAAQGLAA